jgi:acyl-homoserine lactone acylase PvdQ
VDAADLYIEKISRKSNRLFYEYNKTQKPVTKKNIRLYYKNGGETHTKTITALFTHHGPIMTKRNDQWLSVKADNRIMNGLVQCWQRIKAKGFADFKKTMDLRGNISNNTVYADAEGNIAYWHGNRIPVRDKRFDWSKPVDGSITATEWKGLHPVNQTVHIINPVNGWLQNCNSTPFTAAGNNSPQKANYPAYMAPDGENFRGINSVRVLSQEKLYTIEKVIAAGYDTYLAAFEKLVPALVSAFEKTIVKNDTVYEKLNEPVQVLKNWDLRAGENSVATTLAVSWGQKLLPVIAKYNRETSFDQVGAFTFFALNALPQDLFSTLSDAVDELKNKQGNWKIPWEDINRFQRIPVETELEFNDAYPSLPVSFASSQWGMLPSFTSRYYPGTKKRYGYGGNSFICAVEFIRKGSTGGKKIIAKSLLAGGQSGDPGSKHFTDQALMYTKGQFKDVLFYKEDLMKHAEKTYHPGE